MRFSEQNQILGSFFIRTRAKLEIMFGNFFQKPSNERDWSEDQAVLAFADFHGEEVTIHNIRNFSYTSTEDYRAEYETESFALNELVSVDYIVEPFARFGVAHTFLSFGFENGQYISVSIEIRKKEGDAFSPVLGLLRHYELMYVIARERDVIMLRTNHRKDRVYLYPLQIKKEVARKLFKSLLKRANKLKEIPEFYNTLTNSCTTNLVRHANAITPRTISWWDFRLLFPENSDELLYELGLLNTKVPFEELKKNHQINAAAEKYADDPDFSKKIRESGLSI